MKFSYVVYKITFPNGNVYIGKDIGGKGHSIRYFGSWDNVTVENDFTKEELSCFTLKKEIMFESSDKGEVSKKELELILSHNSHNRLFGYNRNVFKEKTKLPIT